MPTTINNTNNNTSNNNNSNNTVTINNVNISRDFLLSQKPIVLWIHDPGAAYNHDAVVNPELFPNFRDGQLLRIHCPRNGTPQTQQPQRGQGKQDQEKNNQEQKTEAKQDQTPSSDQEQQGHVEGSLERESVVVKGHVVDKESLSRQQQLQFSISKDIADRFNLRSRQEVYVELIDPNLVSLDHVELAFKEQYLGRSDMWRLQQSLKGTCVYLEKKILYAGSIKATVKRLFTDEKEKTSGYITGKTKVIFRSASAKYFLFIQMSREMWEFDEDGELYFEKAVSNFLPQLFNRWKDEGTNHVVSIVLFTRVYYEKEIDDPLLNRAPDGRFYKDFYKVLADWETTDDWMTIIGPLKQEQLGFQPSVLMRTQDERQVVSGQISMAYEGNVLEAINLALNPFDKHFVDRDLMRTGLSIILITPGVGKFFVNKKLLRLTNERMTDNGIAMDLVCLSSVPLHITPLMCFMDAPLTFETEPTNAEPFSGDTLMPRIGKPFTAANSPEKAGISNLKLTSGYLDPLYRDTKDAPTQKYYVVPHWVDCSFYHHETGRFIKQDKFKTRCKMYELQMMGIMEHDIKGIRIPYLSETVTKEPPKTRTIKQQRSSSSLNDRLALTSSDGKHNNGEHYLSKSANIGGSTRRTSFLSNAEMIMTPKPEEKTDAVFTRYDSNVFKTSNEPRFGKRHSIQTKLSNNLKSSHAPKSSFEGSERPDSDGLHVTSTRHKTSNDYHFGERRIQGSGTQPQQIVGKSPYDAINRRDDKANDPFRPSPTYTNMRDDHRYRHSRRGTITSTDNKYVSTTVTDTHQNLAVEEEEFAVVSSSTVDPVPINNKGLGCRMDANRKNLNHSPRQGMVSGSIPSIHKQSGNSDLIRTSLGGTNHANRSSPSHGFNRNPLKHILINPCNPSDNHMLFTSHLRRWQHALPKVQPSEGPIVHWRSLVTPACLPLTTDYVPSSEELTGCYSHYMYTVSASEDANLYQAGDKSLSEHEKTENLLVELLSQRLAQGFQIIFIDSGVSGITKINPKQSSETATSTINGYNSTTTKDILRDSIFNIKGTSPTSATNSANSTVAATTTGGGGTGGVRTSNFTNAALATAGANGLAGTGFGNTSDESVAGKMKRKHGIWWLSMGHQIHQLTFDSSGQNVEVRRYVRKISFDVGKISYHCAIWPKNMDSFRPKSAVFSYPSVLYAWNYLDHLVAGYQEELTDNLRFWRARFIVIPRETLPSNITLTGALHDHLDEEEKRLALFESWIQNIRKSKWLAPEERDELQKYRKREIGFSDLGIKLTTMDPSAFVRSEAIKMSSHTSETGSKSHTSILSSIISQGLSRDSKSKDIALALQDPKEGIRIMDRRWHFRLFTEVFTGTEFVDWIIIQFEDITTREQAVQFGNVLMQRKPPLFLSSTKRHTFLDGNYFYTLHEDFIIDRKKTKSGMALSSSRKTMGDGKEREPSIDGQLHKVSSRSSNTHRHSEFSMSKAMIIEVDPYKKSDRRETAILHYDTIHNPNNCYHFQLNWLGCTAQLVQELLQNWSRQAERCGLKLVEGSMDQAYEDTENDNPFQCPVPIPLAAKPPSVDNLAAVSKIDVPQQFYEIALVRHLDFVLDVEADVQFDKAKAEGIDLEYSYIKDVYKYDQYVHKSGVAFVQIRAGGDGFYWVNNRLYTNHTPALIANRRQPTSSLSHPDALRTKFIEHCKNKAWLIEFWERTHANFLQGIDPNSSDAWVFENSGAIVENDPGNVAQQDACSETTVVDHETSNAIEIQDRTLTQTSSITVTLSSPSAIDTKSPSLTQTSTVNSGSPSEMSNIHDRSK